MRAWSGALALGVMWFGCAPCDSLSARICQDLGADCAAWQRPEVRTGLIKEPRFDARRHGPSRFEVDLPATSHEATICRAYARDDTYRAYTLPMARMLVGASTGRRYDAPPPPPADFAAYADLPFQLGLLAVGLALALGVWLLKGYWGPRRGTPES